jgi:hypothetical protein
MLPETHLLSLLTNPAYYNLSLEAGCHLAGQEISHLSGNPQFHNCVHNSHPSDPLFSHMNPVHILILRFFKIHFNSIRPPVWRQSLFSYAFLFHRISDMRSPSHSPWFDHLNNIWCKVQILLLQPRVTSSSFSRTILHTIRLSNFHLLLSVSKGLRPSNL